MQKLNLKSVMFVLFASAFLAGCSSSDTDAAGDASQSGVSSGSSAGTSGLGDRNGLGGDDGSGMGNGRNGNVVYFEFDKADITAESEAMLDKQAVRLKSSGAHIVLEGNCDERGTREYNMALGERRAKSVANYLTVQGVSASQLESVSYGEERPAVDGHDESAWALNRRVELVNR